MPSRERRVVIRDLCVRIGLKSAVTKRSVDWGRNPDAETFYVAELEKLCIRHCNQSNGDIRRSPALRKSIDDLIECFAPKIWPRQSKPRDWLYKVGEGAGNVTYTEDLFYDDTKHYQKLREAIHKLVIAKAIRYRKEHLPDILISEVVRDATYEPSNGSEESTSAANTASPQPSPLCFATYHVGWTASEPGSHNDATRLRRLGVWLGDYHDDTVTINGCSFEELKRSHFEEISLTGESLQTEDIRGDDFLAEGFMECAACCDLGMGTSQPLRVERISLRYDSDEERVWIFPCYYGGKKVFAILKSEDDGQNPTQSPPWSFWKIEGGYTLSEYLLTSSKRRTRAAEKAEPIRLALRSANPIVKPSWYSSDSVVNTNKRDTGKQIQRLKTTVEQREESFNPAEAVQCPTSTDEEQILFEGDDAANVGHALIDDGSSDADDDIPLNIPRNPEHRGTISDYHGPNRLGYRLQSVVNHRKHVLDEDSNSLVSYQRRKLTSQYSPRLPSRPHPRELSIDGVPDTTPLPDVRATMEVSPVSEIPSLSHTTPQFEAPHSRNPNLVGHADPFLSSSQTPRPLQTEAGSQTSEPPNKFKLWLSVRGISAFSIVTVNYTAPIQDVFSDIAHKLERKIAGKRVVALRAYLDQRRQDEDAVDIEMNDHDGWEAVIRHWKTVGEVTDKQYGVVEVE